MASVRGARRDGVRTTSRTPVVQEIVPNSGWTEDSMGHYLLVDLPGFKKEEVKLQVEGSGYIIVRGERQVDEEKSVHFELTFPVPKDSDMDKIAGKFDSEILYVTAIKRSAQGTKETETARAANGGVGRAEESKREEHEVDNERRDHSQHGCHREEERRNETSHIGDFSEELIRKWEKEPSILRRTVEILSKNKGIVITSVIAFSLGLFVSRKFQSSTAG